MKSKSTIRNLSLAVLGLAVLGVAVQLMSLFLHLERFYAAKGMVLSLGFKRNNEALLSCNKAIELNPAASHGLTCRSLVLQALKQYDEVVTTTDKMIELFPNDPGISAVWKLRGCALYKLDRYNEASDSLDTSIKINPNDSDSLFMKCL